MSEAKDKFDGFAVNLLEAEDGGWIAHFAELPNISAHGNSPQVALAELEEAWAMTKEDYLANGEALPMAPARREYSGQFNVRIDRRLHRALATEAARAGVSLNALVARKLERTTVGKNHFPG